MNSREEMTLTLHHDVRIECEGVVAEMREDQDRFELRRDVDQVRTDHIKVSLDEREARALGAVLQAAINWFRQREEKK